MSPHWLALPRSGRNGTVVCARDDAWDSLTASAAYRARLLGVQQQQALGRCLSELLSADLRTLNRRTGQAVNLRTQAGVEALRPGLTGLAQVSGRDELPIDQKARLDAEYLARQSIGLDLAILWRTVRAVLGRSGAY